MRKILFALAASALAIPAIAQVAPTGTDAQATTPAGVPGSGTPSTTGMQAPASDDATRTSNLGLGGLLKQTQAGGPHSQPEKSARHHASDDAGKRVRKARGH
jgi:hypothetical protein